MSCGVGGRCGSDLVLLWLWRRLAATALIRPLAWEPPYATGAAQKKKKKKKGEVHICTVKYCIAITKIKIVPFAETWMPLKIIILSEVSQTFLLKISVVY